MKNLINSLFEPEVKPLKTNLVRLDKDLKPRHLIVTNIDKLHKTIEFRTECMDNSEMTTCKGKILFNQIKKYLNRFYESDIIVIKNSINLQN